MTREILIKLSSKTEKESKVSVRLLSRVLSSVQQTLVQLGKSRYETIPSKAGRTPSVIDRECELFFVKAETGSLSATLELPSKEATLLPDYPNFGETVVSDLHEIMKGVSSGEAEIIHRTVPNSIYRKRIFDILNPILPSTESDYELTFSFEKDEVIKGIKPPKEKIKDYIGPTEKITLVEEKTDDVLIAAKCIATLKNGEISKIIEILDYDLFEEDDLRPFRTEQISWQERSLKLKHEIACSVAKEDHFIVITYEPLNIRAYAVSRDEAIKDFNEEFILLWDEYAEADDRQLSADALLLKKALKDLVAEVVQQ
jgi:hypothetical protein